jgi:hypothetical protein
MPSDDEQHALLRSAFTLDVFQFVDELASSGPELRPAAVVARARGIIEILRGPGPIGQAFRAAVGRVGIGPLQVYIRVQVDGRWVNEDIRKLPPATVAAWVREKNAIDPEFGVRLVLMLLGHELELLEPETKGRA